MITGSVQQEPDVVILQYYLPHKNKTDHYTKYGQIDTRK